MPIRTSGPSPRPIRRKAASGAGDFGSGSEVAEGGAEGEGVDVVVGVQAEEQRPRVRPRVDLDLGGGEARAGDRIALQAGDEFAADPNRPGRGGLGSGLRDLRRDAPRRRTPTQSTQRNPRFATPRYHGPIGAAVAVVWGGLYLWGGSTRS